MSEMRTVDDLYPPKWVRAADLNGHVARVKITAATVEEVFLPSNNSTEKAVILAFEGKKKRLILNKTRCKAMVEITGSKVFKDWVGHTVLLKAAKARNGKDTIEIRPAPSAPPPTGNEPERKPEPFAPASAPEEPPGNTPMDTPGAISGGAPEEPPDNGWPGWDPPPDYPDETAWVSDGQMLTRFWQHAHEMNLTDEEVYAALGVSAVAEFHGAYADASQIVGAVANRKADLLAAAEE